jgi:short-subunit dehydrogenase
MSPFDLSGKDVLITGSTSGIGFEMSKEFNKLGVNLTLLGRDKNE